MKKFFAIFILIAFMGMNQAIAQQNPHNWCGITPADEALVMDRLMRNRANNVDRTLTRMPTRWTPIKFHIVNANDGSGGVSPVLIYDMMCEINLAYADQDIQFYVSGDFNYINNTTAFNNPGSANNVFLSNKVNNAINIYLTKGINGTTSGGGTLGYYTGFFDWLVLRADQVSAGKAPTLVHELGHFFSLEHPFYGWDQDEAYDPVFYGNPAPDFDPMNRPTELMDGSNCMVSGDAMCDTPPCYNFGLGWNGCTYDESVMDPNGTPVNPDETNFMDYFIGCEDNFTNEQKIAISNDLDGRNNLHSNEDFDVTPLAGTSMIYPTDGETTPSYTSVTFEWEEVPGATSYVMEVDRFASFVLDPQVFISTDNFMEVQGVFDPNKKYYWRVKAIKDGYYCSPTADDSSTGEFRTGATGGVATNDISEIVGYSIAPNPLSSNQTLNINLKTSKSFEAKINLFSLSGQKVRTADFTFNLGNSNYALSVDGLAEGMYILSVETESGMLNEKIVVTK